MDAKKAKVFSQLAKNIRVAVREGASGDPKFNAGLRLILDKARAANMPKEKIERAIESGLGNRNGQSLQHILYEAFGPGGSGMLIAAITDNNQRTSAEMRFILSRGGGTLAGPGSAQYLFARQGEEYLPTMPLELSDDATIEQLEKLIDDLRANEDVEDVYVSATWAGKDGEGADDE